MQTQTREFCSSVIVPVFTQGSSQALTAAHKESEKTLIKWRIHEGTGKKKKKVLPLLSQYAGILLLTKAFALRDITVGQESSNTVQCYDDHRPQGNISVSKDFH